MLWDWGRLALMMLGSTLLPGRPSTVSSVPCVPVTATMAAASSAVVATPTARRSLEPLAAPTALQRGYRLPVVAVPSPPPPVASGAPAVASGCPVQVRAIVAGGTQPTDSFAILATAKGSALVHSGEGVHTARGWFTVSSLQADHVILRHDDATFRCFLAGSAASPAPALRSAR